MYNIYYIIYSVWKYSFTTKISKKKEKKYYSQSLDSNPSRLDSRLVRLPVPLSLLNLSLYYIQLSLYNLVVWDRVF